MIGVARIDHSNLFLLGGLVVLASVSAIYLSPKPTRPEPSPSVSPSATESPAPEMLLLRDPDVEIEIRYLGGCYEYSLKWDASTAQYSTLLATGTDRSNPVKQLGKLDAGTGNLVKSELTELSKGCGLISESILSRKSKYSIQISARIDADRSSGCQFSDLDLTGPGAESCRAVVNSLPNTYVGKLFRLKGMVLPTADPPAATSSKRKRP